MTYFNKTYIIAEAGVNHNGSIEMAKKLIDVAVSAGADAVKFQTFIAENLVTSKAMKADYQAKASNLEETQYEMLKKLELNKSEYCLLLNYCKDKEIEFLSTPFDIESLLFLVEEMKLPLIKISSGDIINGPLLLKLAQAGRKVILSTGMSNLGEIETALGVLAYGYLNTGKKPSISSFKDAYKSEEGKNTLQDKVILMHCTSEYPAPFKDINLRAMSTLEKAFCLPVGLSDHTEGIAVSVAAVAKGAVIIEKHFTLDKDLPGPDHRASLNPQELRELVKSIRQVELALGSSIKCCGPSEVNNKNVVRKSLIASKPIKKGQLFTQDNIAIKRPGTGQSPMNYWSLLGNNADRDYDCDEPITALNEV